ncbi:hypothetical protein ABIC28_000360 [Rhodococcus sp. PvR044]|uniref:sialidase family protein n=1 Tax=Rhodococcus sp. OK611 TaxID=2135731 RepID=UPI000BDBC247|nr:sialidase family protein [Rhodococcus sp. OK611]PTR44194.1 hypothetical protein C8K38_10428 [Rhodococcus sp. OK611]SNX89635.1 hypothetical protein SAMN05447004_10327 [Rhodococcus sp. OK270]
MRRAAYCLALSFLFLLVAGPTPAIAQPGPSVLGVGEYPRLVRLKQSGTILASMTSRDAQGYFSPILESTDDGASFHPIGAVRDPEANSGLCCSTLFEVPQQAGLLPPGTLLWAGTVGYEAGRDRRIAIKVWASLNGGRDWVPLGVAARSPNHEGVWEPEFVVDAAGTLWLYYADETEMPRHSQVLSRVSSVNGLDWVDKQVILARDPQRVRPGMAVVTRLADGRFASTYEMCNFGAEYCSPYVKVSHDGVNWGATTDPGVRVTTADGSYFQHSPYLQSVPGGPNGTRLVLGGQTYVGKDGKPSAKNGRVLLANDNFGAGNWFEIPAPVAAPSAKNKTCANYSSPLLPVAGGSRVLQVAVELHNGVCTALFGTGPVAP